MGTLSPISPGAQRAAEPAAHYGTREAQGAADTQALLRLWTENLPVQGNPRDKQRWYYEDNPGGRGTALLLTQTVEGEARPVGCAGIGRRCFYREGKPLVAGQMADFAISRGHRTGLPALLLQRAVRQKVRATTDFGFGFPNIAAAPIFRRLGYHTVGSMTRYVRLLRHGPTLRQRTGLPVAALGLLLDPLVEATWRWRGPRVAGLHLSFPAQIDERFDALWQAQHRLYPLIGVRDATFLRWRFLAQPGARCEVAALVDDDRDALRAYAVLQAEGERMHVRDLFGADLDVLLHLLAPVLRARGFSAISLRFLGGAWMAHLLRGCGFRPREQERAVIVDPASDATELRDQERWYLTDADEDN